MKILLIIMTIVLFLISGCTTTSHVQKPSVSEPKQVVPHTRKYQPISEWEKTEFNKANLDVWPGDVRENLEKYNSTTVAWTGVILEVETVEEEDNIQIIFLAEHHYYDWLEDFGYQPERIFLCTRGEGKFKTLWNLKKSTDISKISEEKGKLLIAYGTPYDIVGDVIRLNTTYIRVIDKKWFKYFDAVYIFHERAKSGSI